MRVGNSSTRFLPLKNSDMEGTVMSHKWLNMGKEIAPKLPIADDVPGNLRILRNALEPETYEILEASSREAILEIAADFLPDTILLSSVPSAMDIYEVYCQLKQNPSTVYIPIIFVTVQSSEKETLLALVQSRLEEERWGIKKVLDEVRRVQDPSRIRVLSWAPVKA